jgi:hypothetical protein
MLANDTKHLKGTMKRAYSFDVALDVLSCPSCGPEQAFQTPPCADGHGLECPDRACTGCGLARVLAPAAYAPAVPSIWCAA